MRLASVLVLPVALGLCSGAAFADPKNETGETWEHRWPQSRMAEVEPNDDCPTAQYVAMGDIVDPASITTGDVDFYKIYLLTTDRLTVLLDRATGCFLGIDTLVDIYAYDGTTILFTDDDDGPGLYSYIMGSEWTPPYSGYYCIKVGPYASGTGCYKIWFYAGLNGDGACCSSAGVCTSVGPGSCTSQSIFQGPGTTCTPNPCVAFPTGACCTTIGVCSLTMQMNCYSPSIWQGANTVCVPNSCPGSQPAPANDTCAGAIVIQRGTTGTLTGDLTWANNDYTTAGGTGCTGYLASGPDVVYVVALQAGDVLHLVYTTPSHDGSLYVITDCANPVTTCVIGEDDPEPETIAWTALTSGTYYIIADAFHGGAAFTLDYDIVCPPPTGSCCYPDGVCEVTTQVDCAATWLAGGGCAPNICGQPSTPCGLCGPGPHWIHTPSCPAGEDNMPSNALAGLDTNLDCVADVKVVLGGPVRVRRTGPLDDSSNYPGTRAVDGHPDVIDTEMLAMTLMGNGVVLSAGAGMGSTPLAPTLGAIAEQPGNPDLADSFFDVFFEVDLGAGTRLYNQTPLRLNSVIQCVPPHETYMHPNVCLPLFTSPVPGQGEHVANLATANHTPFPRLGACCLGQTCQQVIANQCEADGGAFLGEDTVCGPASCPIGGGACCLERRCVVLSEGDCLARGGSYVTDNVGCAPDPCHANSGVEDEIAIRAGEFTLLGNSPNPVHSQTTIRYFAPAAAEVAVEIYAASGRSIRKLDGRILGSGVQGIIWDGRDAKGRPVPTGIYQYRMRIGSEERNGKLTVLR